MQLLQGHRLSADRLSSEPWPGHKPLDTLGALSLSKRVRPYTPDGVTHFTRCAERGNKMAQFGVDVVIIGDRVRHCRAQVPAKAAPQPMQNHGEGPSAQAQARRRLDLAGSAAFD